MLIIYFCTNEGACRSGEEGGGPPLGPRIRITTKREDNRRAKIINGIENKTNWLRHIREAAHSNANSNVLFPRRTLQPSPAQLKIDFAMRTLDESRWMAFRNEGSCWGGGVGRVLVSYELKKVSPMTVTMRIRIPPRPTASWPGPSRLLYLLCTGHKIS